MLLLSHKAVGRAGETQLNVQCRRTLWAEAIEVSKRCLSEDKVITSSDDMLGKLAAVVEAIEKRDTTAVQSNHKLILECAPVQDMLKVLAASKDKSASEKSESLKASLQKLEEILKTFEPHTGQGLARFLQDLWIKDDLEVTLEGNTLQCVWASFMDGGDCPHIR